MESAILVLLDQVEHLKDLIGDNISLLVPVIAQFLENAPLDDFFRPNLLCFLLSQTSIAVVSVW